MGVNWSTDINQTLAAAKGAIPPHLAGLQRGSGLRSLCSAANLSAKSHGNSMVQVWSSNCF